jgi:hypothetical protein
MFEYFKLQGVILNRRMVEFGVHPIVVYPLGLVIFVFLSDALFQQVQNAPFIYSIGALLLLFKLGYKDRNDFLRTIFNDRTYRLVRVLENGLLAIPFIVFLIAKAEYLVAFGLFIVALVVSKFNLNILNNTTVPTPFGQNPFEFARGIRNSYWVYMVILVLGGISLGVDNFGLAMFSATLLPVMSSSYYSYPENEYFVWSSVLSPKRFLTAKVKIALTQFLGLSLPLYAILAIGFYDQIFVLIGIVLASCLFLVLFVLAKYASFPNELSLPIGFLLALCLAMPPLVLVIGPYLYRKAIQSLNPLLHDTD